MKKYYAASFVKTLALLVFLAMAGLVGLYFAGPVVLEAVIIAKMRSAGLVKPHVKVDAITHKGVHLSRISARKPNLQVDSVFAGFSFSGLLQGRLDEIIISGCRYFVEIKDNKPDLGLPSAGEKSGAVPMAFPFKTIDLRSFFLVLNYQEKDYLIPFSSKIFLEDDHKVRFSGWSYLLGLPLSLEGQANISTMETMVQVQAAWSEFLGPGSWFISRENKSVKDPGPVDGRFSLQWTTDSRGKGRGQFYIEAFADGLYLSGPGFGLGLEKGSFSVQALFDDEFYFDRLDADLSLAAMNFNENLLEHLDLSLGEQGALLEMSAKVTHPFNAKVNAGGRQSSINELIGDVLEYEADFQWETNLEIDRNLIDLVSPVELEIEEAIKVFAHGGVKAGFSSGQGLDEARWVLRVNGEKSIIDPVSFFLPEYALRVSDLRFEGPFVLDASSGRIEGGFMKNTGISIREISVVQNSEKYLVTGLDFKNRQDFPFVFFEAMEDGFASLSWHAEQDGGFEADFTDADLLGQGLKIAGKLKRDNNGRQQANVRISPEIALVKLRGFEAQVADIHLDIPFILGDADPSPGSLSTGEISFSGVSFPGMTGQIIIHDYQVKSRGEWPFLPGAKLEFFADITPDPDKGATGRISAHTEWFDFPEKEIIDRLVPALTDMTMTGSAKIGLDIDLRGSAIRPQARIDFRDAEIAVPDMDMEGSRIRGSVVIDDFFPLTTPGNQRIDVGRFRIGLLELEEGFLTFRLESPESIFLERTRWNLLEGGFIAAHASRFNLQDMSADLEIFFENIDLLKLVSRLSQEKIVGSGLVYGRVPLQYKQDRVTIGDGYLYSAPGAGRLGIRDEDWLETLLLYVRDAMSGHPYLSLVSERLEQALRDFEYNFLAVKLVPGLEDTSARVELRGRGVKGDPPQEVGSLVINVNDLGEIVNRVLRFQLSKDESIERALDELFDFQ